MLERLRRRLGEINTEIRGLFATAERETRDAFNETESARYTELRAEREQVEARIAELEDEETRAAAAAEAARATGVTTDERGRPAATITNEPTTYGRGSGNSYFLDIARAQIRGDQEALSRLTRHAQELDVELPAREARRTERAHSQARREFGEDVNPFERRTNPNRTDGQGGYFVPPLWLVDEYVPFLRNGRPFANLCRAIDLPGGTDSINVPKVSGGTATGVQTADAGAVTSQDMTDTSVSAPVRTIAGQQDIAMQLLDQSPVAFDEIVFMDLIEDYNVKVDTQCIQGSGASGQVLGLDNVSGVNAVTYTDASPTGGELFVPLAQALSQVAKNRKRPAQVLLMHAIRWYWLASQLDGNGRPLVTPFAGQGFNPLANQDGQAAAEGPVGNILGATVVLDQSITTADGAGTNQDRVYGARPDDYYLFEGSLRTRAMTEVLSGTLQVRLQVFNYVAFMPHRYATATSIVSGTGLVAPSGF